MDDAFLPHRRRKVLGGGENRPHRSNLFEADWTWCYVVTYSAIRQPHPALKPYQQRVQTINKLMVWFSAGRDWLMALGFFVEDTAKTDAASNSRVTIGECLVWGQISCPSVNQDIIGKLRSRAFYWCNKNAIVPL